MSELRECPFCGGKARLTDSTKGDYSHRVQCTKCGVSSLGTRYLNDEFNSKQWNTRAIDEQTIREDERRRCAERVKASLLTHGYIDEDGGYEMLYLSDTINTILAGDDK